MGVCDLTLFTITSSISICASKFKMKPAIFLVIFLLARSSVRVNFDFFKVT